MQVLGISIEPGGGMPRLFGAIVSGTIENPVLDFDFDLRAPDSDPAEQAVDLARLLLAKLPGLTFSAAVVRIAGARPVASRQRAQFSRAHAEGAVIYVLREHLGAPIAVGDPRSFAKSIGQKKEDLIAKAKAMSAGQTDAVLAAISGLPIE